MDQKAKKLTRRFSAGGALYRIVAGRPEWLLIKPAGKDRWQLPKGEIDEGEGGIDTAVREVFEEAGVKGRVVGKIDTIKFFYRQGAERIFKHVAFFLMEYKSGQAEVLPGSEHEIDEVAWVPAEEAIEKLTFESEKGILRKAASILAAGTQSNLF